MRKLLIFLVLSLCMSLMHSTVFAARGGVCYEKASKNSKHIFFSIQEGKRVLLDLKRLNKMEQALDLEKKLLAIEKRNTQMLKEAAKKCNKAVVDSKKALAYTKKIVADLKKQLQKAWSDILVLKGQVQKLKRQRVTYFLVGFGIGAMVAGGIAIAVNSVAQNEQQLRAGLIGAGAGGMAVGASLIGIAIFR